MRSETVHQEQDLLKAYTLGFTLIARKLTRTKKQNNFNCKRMQKIPPLNVKLYEINLI